jgi:Na+/H+-dicarboxylate symporter
MGVILPFYSIIDMIETSLNVWSDTCVAKVLNDQLIQEEVVPEVAVAVNQ